MSELSTILVPLTTTFPGWPAAPQVSIVQFLVVLVALPVAISAVVALCAFGGSMARRGEGGVVRRKEPVWLGSAAPVKAITSEARSEQTGGASVHW